MPPRKDHLHILSPGSTHYEVIPSNEGDADVKIVGMRAFPRRNVHSHHPVVEIEVDLEGQNDRLTSEIDGFYSRLLSAFPGLKEHYCSRGHPGGFVERLYEGTLLGHVLEHMILQLQSAAGCDVIYGKTRRLRDSRYMIVVEYQCEEVVRVAADQALSVLRALLRGEDVCGDGARQKVVQARHEFGLGPSTTAIVEAAERRGIPVMRLDERSLLQMGYGSEQKKIQATITGETCCVGVDTVCDKALCKDLLAESGIKVPEGALVQKWSEALGVIRRLRGPVVIKPNSGSQGEGVSLNLSDEDMCRQAFELARDVDEQVLIERYIPGRQYRVLVVGDEVVAASEKIPPRVTGDGKATIKQLVEKVNSDPSRGKDHEAPLTRIPLDEATIMTLRRQGLAPDSVAECGQQVRLRDGANLSTGGTAVDVTDEIHPSLRRLCRRAVRVVDLDVAGVDLVGDDLSRPVPADGEGGPTVVEINAAPGLRMHQWPSEGKSRDAAQAIVDHLFPSSRSAGRIPIVAITGSNGKTTTARLIAHVLNTAGYAVGLTTTDGIFIDEQLVVEGDTTGPWSSRLVLRDPSVEAAVLEVARGGIIHGGLAFDYCDVGLVTNITGDHLGQDGIETTDDLVRVKSLVVESVPRWGKAVLNADDPQVIKMQSGCLGETVLFSVEESNLSLLKHLNAGHSGVYASDGRLQWARGRKVTPLIRLDDVPLTMGGTLQHNIENLAAAVASALALGISTTAISKAVHSFRPEVHNPGRFEVFSLEDRKVVVDYGHNQAGFAAALKAVDRMNAQQVVGVIGMPGDRRDSDLKMAGRTAAGLLDRIIIKEDAHLRGRKKGEAAGLLLEGVLQAFELAENVDVVLDEGEAVRCGLDLLKPGGILVIFYEDYRRTTKQLEEWSEKRGIDLQRIPDEGSRRDDTSSAAGG